MDLEGNGCVNRGEYVLLMKSGTNYFLAGTSCNVSATYEPSSAEMCNATFYC